MKLNEINTLIKSINEALIQPSNYPLVRKEGNTLGFIKRKQDESWMSKEVFEEIFSKLSRCSESQELIIAEDFERVYKSSGKTVRLNDVVLSNWLSFSHFCSNNEMISFYVFDRSLTWCGWFNDGYWCLVFESSFRDAIKASNLNIDLAYQSFPEADVNFKSFIANLYSDS